MINEQARGVLKSLKHREGLEEMLLDAQRILHAARMKEAADFINILKESK